MGRKILFITTDQMRHDALGCNGGTVARTPAIDTLAAQRHQLPASPQSKRDLHAGSSHHHDEPTCGQSRGLDERG